MSEPVNGARPSSSEEVRDRRRALGAFETPPALAHRMAEAALDAWRLTHAGPPRAVVDPACGTGVLLEALAEQIRSQWPRGAADGSRTLLAGLEIEAGTAATARERLRARGCEWECAPVVLEGDALEEATWGRLAERMESAGCGAGAAGPGGCRTLDVVIGNPPFGNAIRHPTARTPEQRQRWARAFPFAARGAFDKASLFLELALRRVARGGTIAFLVPRALLAQPAAAELRAWCDRCSERRAVLDVDGARHFEGAVVHVAMIVLSGVDVERDEMGRPSSLRAISGARAATRSRGDLAGPGEEGEAHPSVRSEWGSPEETEEARDAEPRDGVPLGELFDIRASATVAEAYALRSALTETQPEGEAFRFVTSGAIEPGRFLWAERVVRYLGVRWARPWLPANSLSGTRLAQARAPKVLVAGLSRVIEAAPDANGEYVGAVATLVVRPRADASEWTPARIADLLNSDGVRRAYRARFGALALSGGNVPVTKAKLASIRVEVDRADGNRSGK